MPMLALVEERAAAGATVHGRVDGSGESPVVAVELVRLEQSPAGSATFCVASAELAADGAFALVVPADAPPEVTGPSCALRYVIRVCTGAEELHRPLTVTA
jgi:hypothetical protein